MGSLVCTGATLQCSLGTLPSTFTASGATVTAGGAGGVVTDCEVSNVAPFGLCTSPANPAVAAAEGAPQPCLPVLAPWTPGSGHVTLSAVPALDDASQCQCAWGGVVTVTDAGQAATTLE